MAEKDSRQVESLPAMDDLKENPPLTKRDVDIGQMLEMDVSPAEERNVLLKLDLLMIPLMGVCYMMQYIDKLALSQAALLGLRKDLNLQGNQYSWTSAIFYFGYLVWSWPSSYLIVRLPLGKYVSISVFLWGGFLMCHAAAVNFGGLMTARFFLGAGEAAIAPGFGLIIGMFYTREEQPSRQSGWYYGNCVANLVGGLIAYGIGSIDITTIANWQLLFLFLGAITSFIGIVLFILLPDSPANAIFLNKWQRAVAVQRTVRNKTGVLDTGSFKWEQAWMAVKDPQTWFLILFNFCVNLCNGGITTFSAIIINGFGYSKLQSLLMQMPMGGAQIVFLTISTVVTSFIPSTRIVMMVINCAASMVGMILIWKLDQGQPAGQMVGITLGAVFGVNIPLSLSLISSNVAGFTKRSVTSALLFIAYCVGNIVGPQFFLASEEPNYPTGIKAAMSGLVLGMGFLLGLMGYYTWENHRRNRIHGRPEDITEGEELAQDLSNRTDREIPSFRYVL